MNKLNYKGQSDAERKVNSWRRILRDQWAVWFLPTVAAAAVLLTLVGLAMSILRWRE